MFRQSKKRMKSCLHRKTCSVLFFASGIELHVFLFQQLRNKFPLWNTMNQGKYDVALNKSKYGVHQDRTKPHCLLVHIKKQQNVYLVGGFTPSEKYESQLGLSFLIYGKTKNLPNHQPVYPPVNSLHDYGKSPLKEWVFPEKMLDLSIVTIW